MRFPRQRGSTQNIVRVFIPDNSVTTGAGCTGLTSASTNLTIVWQRTLGAKTTYTGSNIVSCTAGSWADAGSGKIGFVVVDATAFPGLYELQFSDTGTVAFGTQDLSDAVIINIYEATTSALKIGPNMVMLPLVPWNYQDGVRMGLTALPNAAANAAGGLPVSIAGGLDLDEMNTDVEAIQAQTDKFAFTVTNQVDANVLDWKSATAPAMTGDAYASIGAAGAGLTALGDTRIANLDATVSSVQALLPAALVGGKIDANIGSITAGVIAAASFAANALDAVWSTTARILTAGTNIVLAKGAGVTGFNDLDAAGIRTATGMSSANLDTQLSAINSKTTNLPPTPADESLIIAATDSLASAIGALPTTTTVSAIKSQTDKFEFTIANQVNANIKSVNDVTVNGVGSSGSPWGP